MLDRMVSPLVRLFVRFMPDALVVAILLWLLTVVLAVTLTGTSPLVAIELWGDSFWNLLTFTNQITLTLLFGYAFANTAPVRSMLMRIAGLARTARAAYVLACVVTGLLALFSWGLSLIAAGIMARALGEACKRRGIRVHYPLLVASAFSGFVIWHQGLSASIGLVIATPGHFLEEQIGLIPTSLTLFTPWNAAVALFVLVTLPILMSSLHPSSGLVEEIELDETTAAAPASTAPAKTPAQWLERSTWLALTVVVAGGVYLWIHYGERGRGLELNILNFTFLLVGLLLAGSALRYAEIIMDGGRVAAPFLLQYPFYAGIAGLMAASGLAQIVVELFVDLASAETLPLYGLLSGGLLNLFVPSGGGQWAVQGPIMMAAAQELGADLPRVAMSVALGDQWTNLIQPLALLPVLAIARIQVSKIMGYTFIALFWTGAVFAVALLF
ncbi:MAG TPA: TIGR00366 family protein [Thermoanaerobaculia bacterium]|nr:TIGR00366 family protein [Thermoanaerobaculia bacterium]